ncbi:hypothetical protein LCGC14_2994150 [marine sediment metagenome]|uniref:Uncharacterized protein n=1 Tax=marine sediment metagenome TaxID=412755 RepID=A0A0F8X2Z9_9ZZZZ
MAEFTVTLSETLESRLTRRMRLIAEIDIDNDEIELIDQYMNSAGNWKSWEDYGIILRKDEIKRLWEAVKGEDNG